MRAIKAGIILENTYASSVIEARQAAALITACNAFGEQDGRGLRTVDLSGAANSCTMEPA